MRNQLSSDGFPYDARTAISAVYFNGLSNQATVVAIGDVLTVVFDGKTGIMKYQQNARVYNQGGSIWAPVDIQMLAHSNPEVVRFARSAIQHQTWCLDENDVIIQMTDGIWSEFETIDQETKTNDGIYIETQLKLENIQDLDPVLHSFKTMSTVEIAQAIQNRAICNFCEKLKLFRQIHPILSERLTNETSTTKTMAEFLSELNVNDFKVFHQLFIAKQHDAVSYHDEMPVILFRKQYQNISFGD